MQRLMIVASLKIALSGTLFSAFTIALAENGTSHERVIAQVAREAKGAREPLFSADEAPSVSADYQSLFVRDVPVFFSDTDDAVQSIEDEPSAYSSDTNIGTDPDTNIGTDPDTNIGTDADPEQTSARTRTQASGPIQTTFKPI